jgi:hypothetical protein
MAKSAPRTTKTTNAGRRRPYDYDHEYGLGGGTKRAVPKRAARGVSKSTSTRKKKR